MFRSGKDLLRAACVLGALASMPALPASAATYAYVGHGGGSEIRILQLAPDGALTPVQQVPFPGMVKAGGSLPLALSPDHRFLYAGLRGEPLAVASFAIDPASGRLSHLGNAPLADSMAYIATDRSGRWLLSASYGGNQLGVNPIGADGRVGLVAHVVPTEPNAHEVLADPSNRFVLASNLGGDIVMQLRFDAASGTLTPNDPPFVRTEPKTGPRHFRFSQDGSRVYLVGELDCSVSVYGYDGQAGQLSLQQRSSALPAGFTGKPWCADLHLTPDGGYLYASERTSSTLAAFKVDPASGALTPIASFPTETQPRGFAIDSSGHYLLSVGQLSDGLTVHRIDPATGRLSSLAHYDLGKSPDWVEIIDLP